MKSRFLSYGITAAVMVLSCVAPMDMVAQSRSDPAAAAAALKAAAARPTPRAAGGHPDRSVGKGKGAGFRYSPYRSGIPLQTSRGSTRRRSTPNRPDA